MTLEKDTQKVHTVLLAYGSSGCKMEKLFQDFKETWGCTLVSVAEKYGFPSSKAFLQSIPEKVKIVGNEVFGISDDKTKKNVDLIDQSASNAHDKKKRKEKYNDGPQNSKYSTFSSHSRQSTSESRSAQFGGFNRRTAKGSNRPSTSRYNQFSQQNDFGDFKDYFNRPSNFKNTGNKFGGAMRNDFGDFNDFGDIEKPLPRFGRKPSYDEDLEEWQDENTDTNYNNSPSENHDSVVCEGSENELKNLPTVPPGFPSAPPGYELEEGEILDDDDNEIFHSAEEWNDDFELDKEDNLEIDGFVDEVAADPNITKNFPLELHRIVYLLRLFSGQLTFEKLNKNYRDRYGEKDLNIQRLRNLLDIEEAKNLMVVFKGSPMKGMFEFVLKGTVGYINLNKDYCAKKNEKISNDVSNLSRGTSKLSINSSVNSNNVSVSEKPVQSTRKILSPLSTNGSSRSSLATAKSPEKNLPTNIPKIENDRDIYDKLGPDHKNLLTLAGQIHSVVVNKQGISLTELCEILKSDDNFELLKDSRTLLMEFLTKHFKECFKFTHCEETNDIYFETTKVLPYNKMSEMMKISSNFYRSDYLFLRKDDHIQVILRQSNVLQNEVNLIFQLADSHMAQEKLNEYLSGYDNLLIQMDELPVSSRGYVPHLEQCVFYRQENPQPDESSLLRCRVLSMETSTKLFLECLDSGKQFWACTDLIFDIPEIFSWERFPATAIFATLNNFEELKKKFKISALTAKLNEFVRSKKPVDIQVVDKRRINEFSTIFSVRIISL